jgi:hypothetical protein
MSQDDKEAFKAKLRSLTFYATGPKYVEQPGQVFRKIDDTFDKRDNEKPLEEVRLSRGYDE